MTLRAGITISRATRVDAEPIRALEQRVWAERDVTGRYEVGPIIRFGRAFVAKRAGRVIGAILASPTLDGSLHVSDWVVDKRWRRRGIGRKLYDALLRAEPTRRLVTIVGRSQRPSLRAHRTLGFRCVASIRDPYGLGERRSRLLLVRDPTNADPGPAATRPRLRLPDKP
jgi:ribosomal protein S18 acetylase RimI-like enzyme